MGALTAKTYSFKYRPWELSSNFTVNAFDPFGSFLRVQLSNNTILRVLPKISSSWLADNMRFFMDGLKRRRVLDFFYFNFLERGFIKYRSSENRVLGFFKMLISFFRSLVFNCIIVDSYKDFFFESIFHFIIARGCGHRRFSFNFYSIFSRSVLIHNFDTFMDLIDSSTIQYLSGCLGLPLVLLDKDVSFSSLVTYTQNRFSQILDLKVARIKSLCVNIPSFFLNCSSSLFKGEVFLFGLNFRFQLPLIMHKLRQYYLDGDSKLFFCGNSSISTFKFIHFCNSSRGLNSFSKGKNVLCLSGGRSFDSLKVLFNFNLADFNWPFITLDFIKKNFSFLFMSYGEISSLFTGITSSIFINRNFNYFPLVFSFEFPSVFLLQLYGFRCLFTSHGFFWDSELVDLVFPLALFVEKENIFISHSGFRIHSSRVINQPNLQSFFYLMKFIFKFFGIKSSNFLEPWIRSNSSLLSFKFIELKNILSSDNFSFRNNLIGNSLAGDNIYGRNSICMSSSLLQLCERVFFSGNNYL